MANFRSPRGLAIVASRERRSGLTKSAGPAKPKSVRDLEHANEIKAAIEALGPDSAAGEDFS